MVSAMRPDSHGCSLINQQSATYCKEHVNTRLVLATDRNKWLSRSIPTIFDLVNLISYVMFNQSILVRELGIELCILCLQMCNTSTTSLEISSKALLNLDLELSSELGGLAFDVLLQA